MVEDPAMTSHILSGLKHPENGGCMGFVGVKQNSGIWQMLADKHKWQRNVNLGKDLEQFMLERDLTRQSN